MAMRLHNRLQIKGGAALSPEFAAEGREEETAIGGAPVMVADNATRFLHEASGRGDWRAGTNLPPLPPSFGEASIEAREPRGIFDSKERSVVFVLDGFLRDTIKTP